MKEWVVTGINRLTKEREIISSPAERQDIERLIAKLRTRKVKRSAVLEPPCPNKRVLMKP